MSALAAAVDRRLVGAIVPASIAALGLALYVCSLRRRSARTCDGSLSHAQVTAFKAQGYVIVQGLLDRADLDPLQEEFDGVIAALCEEEHADGASPSTFEHLPFHERYLALCKATGKVFSDRLRPALPAALHTITEQTPCHFGKAVFGLVRNPKLLSAVGSIIGEEITSNPIQNARIKPPEACLNAATEGLKLNAGLVAATPWHQDNGVCTADADGTDMVTAWVPLHDIDENNAPLRVLPCSHQCGLQKHCVSRTSKEVHLPDEAISRIVALTGIAPLDLPMRRGDVLLLHPWLVHSSAPNHADRIRFSFDLRFNATGQPTGRDAFPAFVVRSRANPASECRSHVVWEDAWLKTRQHYADEAAAARKYAAMHPDAELHGPLLGRDRWTNDRDAIMCA